MLPREVDKLFFQYSKLRKKIVRDEMSRFTYRDNESGRWVYDKAQLDDLKSYVDYQFVKLTKEYNPNSGVDFPGYIKSKLKLRTAHSYIKRKYDHYYRTHDLHQDNNKLAESALYMQSLQDWKPDEEDGILAKIQELDLKPIEKDIIQAWLQPPAVGTVSTPIFNSNRAVYQLLKRKYPDYSQADFIAEITHVRKKLQKLLS